MTNLTYLLIDAAQAAKVLGVVPKRVRTLCAEGRIPGAKMFGKNWQIPARVRAGGVLDVKVTPGTRGPELRIVTKTKKRGAEK